MRPLLGALVLFVVNAAYCAAAEAAVVTRYTTSTARGAVGTGECLTTSTRCTNRYALSLSNPGDTVSVEGNTISLPFEYKGDNDMLKPPAGRSGNSGARISVRCETDAGVAADGGCLINAEFAAGRIPMHLSSANQYWEIVGFNFKSAGGNGVIRLESGSSFNRVIRVVAWDAPINANDAVVQILFSSSNNEFIDFAAFGTGRKIWVPYDGSNNNVCRRCWFRWEGHTGAGGGAAGGSPFYLSTGTVWENVLITWSGESMPETYIHADGSPQANFEVKNPGGPFSPDRIESLTTPKNATARIRGSMVYIKDTDRMPSTSSGQDFGGRMPMMRIIGASDIQLSDVIAVMSNQHQRFNNHLGFALTRREQNCAEGVPTPCESPVASNSATRITSVRGTKQFGANQGDSFGRSGVGGYLNETDWSVTNKSQGNCVTNASKNPCTGLTVTAVQTPWQNNSTDGARLCHPTENGVVQTGTPLWPWPMNERIKKATGMAGRYSGPCTTNCVGGMAARTETDVTADIEELMGTIPTPCKVGTTPSFPDALGFNPAQLTTF